jgi:hypothetical protein
MHSLPAAAKIHFHGRNGLAKELAAQIRGDQNASLSPAFSIRAMFWTTADLEAKLREFPKYFNEHPTLAGLEGRLPDSDGPGSPISFVSHRWRKHCRGLYQTPIAA